VRLFRLVVMGPPFTPGLGILAERGAGDGLQGGINQVLSLNVDGIVIQKIQELGNSGQTLLAGEHTGTREVGGGAFANLFRGIVSENGKKRVDRFLGAQHGQSFNSPEADLLIRILGIALKRGQNLGGLNAAIAEGTQSPQGEIAAVRIVMNLVEKFCETLRRFPEIVGDQIDFHGGDANARIVGVEGLQNDMEELVCVVEAAAPGIEILVDQAERLVGTMDSEYEEALGLLLRRQVTDGFEVGTGGAGFGSGHERG